MALRITNWKHVIGYAALVILLTASAPAALLAHFLPPMPLFLAVPIYVTGIAVPVLIVVPLATCSLYMFKLINATIDRLDNHVKFDHLTGLLSRGYFLGSVEQSRKRGGYFLMIDADHFKKINDTHGHETGDEALRLLAQVTAHHAATAGLAGRLGGEEFAVYLPGASQAQAVLFAATLGSDIRGQSLVSESGRVQLTVSIGLAEDRRESSLAQVMKAADQALYAAKAQGRDRHVLAAPRQSIAA
jgi:diguanylate cyclase (GGDEF)-like protein